MKNHESRSNPWFKQFADSFSSCWLKVPKLTLAGVVMLAAALWSPAVHAQTTFKPFQVRAEWPSGVAGTMLLTNNNLRVATNGASVLDGTGTNWVISPVTVSVAGAPAGVTVSLTDSSGNDVSTIPVNLNTGSTAMNTNLVIKLVFDGTQTGATSTIGITFAGGVTNGYFALPLDLGKIWNGRADAADNGAGSWSDAAQWLGGVPGPGDAVVFADVGTQTNSLLNGSDFLTNSLVDTSVTIASLRFAVTNETSAKGAPKTNYDNIFINAGQALAIKGDDGFSILRDYTYWNSGPMNITFEGTDGTFIETNENASFSILSDGQAKSLLDMSGLGNMYLDINRFYLSDYLGYPNYETLVYTNGYSNTTAAQGKPQRFYQIWNLAGTNYVKATYVDPDNYTNSLTRNYALTLGRNEASGGGSGQDVEMYMGYSNIFNLDSMCVGGSFCLGADLRFLNTGSYAKFRNADGVSRMSIFATADAGGPTLVGGLGDNTKCGGNGPGVDFTRGTVDMMVDRLYLSMDRSNVTANGKGVSQTSGFEFADGTVDANTAILGYQSQGNQTNQSYCYATMTVSNTATLRVNDTLALGYATADMGSPNNEQSGYGRLNIGPGGTVMANNITVGGVTKASTGNNIVLTGGASLIVSNTIADATPNGALGTLSFGGDSSLTLFINGTNPMIPLVYVTNLVATGTGNGLVIGGVTNLTYPAYVPLIAGAGSPTVSAAAFDAGVSMPAGSGLHGTLITSSSNTVDLEIIARAPHHLLWRAAPDGTGSANWDYTTKNWLDQDTGLMTNYTDPDIVSFDDTPGYATNINVSGSTPLIPTAINITNNTVYYTFLGSSSDQIIGGPALNKYGAGGVEVDANTTFAVQVNQGALLGISPGSVGGVNVGSGALMNYGGTIGGNLISSGTATSFGSVAGTVTVLAGGVVTNSGSLANPFSVQSGGLFYNSDTGSLNNIGTGSSAAPQVASGGTLINNGVISGDVLYIAGIFEDLGGGSDSMTLTSVSVAPGATFIPGGAGIGTTTINSDGVGKFPGAALLSQGSTNVFNVDMANPQVNTILNCDYLSYGGSSSVRSENGCTLQINNIGATPFGAGQSFQLFKNIYGNPVPFNTGSSTNTYPVISPATPGAGLAWNLQNLWVNGSIGVVPVNSGPALTNSFFGDGSGTNIVAQFSWDPSYYGYRLETLVVPNTVGLAPSTNYSWTGVSGSWTKTSETLTNVLGTNSVFYRLVFP